MKRLLTIWPILGTLLFVPVAAASETPAAPVSALFYPDEIHLTVEDRLAPTVIPGKGAGLRIVLPAEATRNSFSISVNEVPANSFYWLDKQPEAVPLFSNGDRNEAEENSIEAKRQPLLDAITEIEEGLDARKAASKARKARISLWENLDTGDEKFKTDDILKLDTVFSERLEDLYAAESKNERAIAVLQQKLEKAHAALILYDTSHVRHHVAVIPFSGDKPVSVRYSYIMPGTSSTAYRLVAYPTRDALSIEQDVTLFQNSGKTWNDVDIYVSTARRDKTLRPRPLSPWRITLMENAPPVEPRSFSRHNKAQAEIQMSQMARLDMNAMEIEGSALPPAPAPVQEEKGTFRLWSLGKKTIASGVGVTLPLAKDEHNAKYYYTLQPSVNPRGFLTASLALEKALELPRGTARLFVDDVAIGEQAMAINGTKATIFFGTDPLVTATMRDLKHSTGEKGLISKEQTVLWHWEITVRNARGRAVEVSIQDPLPEEQDTAVKLAVESTPMAEKATTASQLGATKIYEWKFTLQPNETRVIKHKVEITAPADKFLQTGRKN